MKKILTVIFGCLSIITSSALFAEIHGKADIGPIYASVDVISSSKKVKNLSLWGVRGDATIAVYSGFVVRPSYLYAGGDGDLQTAGLGFGFYYPVTQCFSVIPTVGFSYSHLTTDIEDTQIAPVPIILQNHFESKSVYVGGDINYKVNEKLTLTGAFQYAWASSRSKISNGDFAIFVTSKTAASGTIWSFMADYKVWKCLSANISFAINNSMNKEKSGIRGKGVRVGMGYTF